MSAGTRWRLPDGRDAIEIEGSTARLLKVIPIRENWPWPLPPIFVLRGTVKRLPSRYLRETPQDVGEARW